MFITVMAGWASNAAMTEPGRVAAMKWASSNSSSGRFHWTISGVASAPEMKNRSASLLRP